MGKEQARQLRNNSTPPEILLWNQLKQDKIGFQFRRQKCVGPYVIDFYCPAVKLAVEVDGRIHQFQRDTDQMRDSYLESVGITIFRIPAGSVLRDAYAVAQMIREACERLSPNTR